MRVSTLATDSISISSFMGGIWNNHVNVDLNFVRVYQSRNQRSSLFWFLKIRLYFKAQPSSDSSEVLPTAVLWVWGCKITRRKTHLAELRSILEHVTSSQAGCNKCLHLDKETIPIHCFYQCSGSTLVVSADISAMSIIILDVGAYRKYISLLWDRYFSPGLVAS